MRNNEDQLRGFKLLAIRPLKGCDSRFRKNLKEGVLYQFYQNYHFEFRIEKNGDEIVTVTPNQLSTDLFSFKTKNGKKLDINISVVVGANGSGKSTLMELFYLAVYLCDLRQILTHMKQKDGVKNFKLDSNDTIREILEKYTNYKDKNTGNQREHRFYTGFKSLIGYPVLLEIYYQDQGEIFRLSINSENKNRNELYEIDVVHGVASEDNIKMTLPFYSIALNYSIHSLNSQDMGNWIHSIFHKNDAYQTPLVINPKRTDGDIDMENEKTLQKTRMLANTMEIKLQGSDVKPLFNNKNIHRVNLKLHSFRVNGKHSKLLYPDSLNFNIVNNSIGSLDLDFINRCNEYKVQLKINKAFEECSWIEREAYAYLDDKIPKILKNYQRIFEQGKVNELLGYDSHVTFKLWQAIHFIDNECQIKTHFRDKVVLEDIVENGKVTYSKIKEEDLCLSIYPDKLENLYSKKPYNVQDQINLLPPPIFEYDLQFSEDENDTFSQLSSGEKQQIYSIHTLMYHIRNVASVKKDYKKGLEKYRSINVLLDEVELYFHPEMQRVFIKRLLDSIKVLGDRLENDIYSVNFMMVTHSPFILSDIPSSNILKLKDGHPIIEEFQTFGANIHDLLANDFYLENGFMGEFAKNKIKSLIDYLNSNYYKSKGWNLKNSKEFIEIIGEPFLKDDLLDLHKTKKSKLMSKVEIEEEIERLTKQLKDK